MKIKNVYTPILGSIYNDKMTYIKAREADILSGKYIIEKYTELDKYNNNDDETASYDNYTSVSALVESANDVALRRVREELEVLRAQVAEIKKSQAPVIPTTPTPTEETPTRRLDPDL